MADGQQQLLASQPVLLMMKGHPGSGKSSVAEQLAARTRWVLADKDDARNVFEESPGIRAWAKSCEDGLEVLNSLAYAVMFSVAQKQLFCGNSVIVDCPLARPSLYERGKALASQNNARIAVVECLPSDTQEWRRRLEARAGKGCPGQAHKPQSWTAVTELRAKYQGCDEWPQHRQDLEHHLVLDTTPRSPIEGSPVALAEQCIQWLVSRGLYRHP